MLLTDVSRYAFQEGMNDAGQAERRREALRAFIESRGLKIKPWCEEAEVSYNSVYNFLNGHSQSLKLETYQKLSFAARVPVEILLGHAAKIKTHYGIIVVGKIQAGSWNAAATWPEDDRFIVSVPVPERYIEIAYGLLVAGPSMNELYPEGSVVVCVPVLSLHRDLKSGDRVHVDRMRTDGLVESTVKELRADSEGAYWLWPRSLDPTHQRPIPLNSPDGDVESVEIKGIVIGSYRPEGDIM